MNIKFNHLFLLLVFLVASCSSPSYLSVQSGSDTFHLKVEDVMSMNPDIDVNGKQHIEISLTESGQYKMKEFTQKHIGDKISVFFNKQPVLKDIPIAEANAMATFYLSIEDEALIPDITKAYKK